LKTVVKFFSVLFLIGLILILVLLLLVELNKPFIISKAETWYAENRQGELEIRDFDFQIIRDFPNLNIQIHQISIRDSSFAGRNYRRVSAGEINFRCTTRKLFRKELEFSRFELKDVDLNILVDTLDLVAEKADESARDVSLPPDLEKWLHNKGIDFIIQDARIRMINHPKKRRYTGTVNDISGQLIPKGSTLSGLVSIDIDMDEMGLNIEKGTYFNTAHLRGTLEPKIDLSRKEFFTPPFSLKIDDQDFLTSAHFNLGKENFFDFELINEVTDYKASKELITKDIQEKISDYQLVYPFYTKTKIQGKFHGEGNPLVTLDFNTSNNQCIFQDSIFFDTLDFTGHLANRKIDDEKLNSKNEKDFHIIFKNASAYYQSVPFELKDSYIQTTPAIKNFIQLNLRATGATKRLNEILKNDAFFFKSGNFDLISKYRGDTKKPLDVITYANSQLKINQTKVFYNKADLTIPVRKLLFTTQGGNAQLKSMRLDFPKDQTLNVTGKLENYTSLLFDELDKPLKSILTIESKNLNYDGLISTIRAATEETALEELQEELMEEEKDLKAAFENIYLRFNPTLSIKIDTFSYKKISIEKLKTSVTYKDKNTLKLTDSSFNFGDGSISLDGRIHLPEGNATLAILGIEANGSMESLNELFNNDAFMLRSGSFNLTADYEGALEDPENIVTGSVVDLRIQDVKIHHADQNLVIPIDNALISLKKRDAEIIALKIPFSEGNSLSITRKVENFTSLLQEEKDYKVQSSVLITSDELNSRDFKKLTEMVPESDNEKQKNPDAIHRGIATVYSKFQPTLEIKIDKISDSDYLVRDLSAAVYYQDSTTLVVEKTGFKLDDGRLDLDAIFNFSEKKKISSNIILSANGKAQRFNKLFNNNTFFFKEGIFTFKLNFDGDVLNRKSIIENIDSRLTLNNSKVFYKDMNLTVPLDNVDLTLKNKDAVIKSFVIPLTSGHRIEAKGEVVNFNTLLLDSIPVDVVSNLTIYSKELDFRDLSKMFDVITQADSLSQDEPELTIKKTNVFKPTIQGIYDKFLPTVNVIIDDFSYKTFEAKNIKTGLIFRDRNHLELQKTAFELGDSRVLLDAELDLTEKERTGFSTDFMAKNINLEKLIPAFDFFNLPSLKTANSVSGILSVNSHLTGHVIDKNGKLDNTLKGEVAFDLESLRLKNFGPIMSTAGKILRDKRIEDIQFLTITDTLKIDQGTIKIPRLNINSTAFTLHMRGDFRYDNKSNMLISIPWSNLWFWDSDKVPERMAYDVSGRKFHIHALGNEENTMDYKFRFSARKWYKKQGISHLYCRDKKISRLKRKRYKAERKKRKRRDRKGYSD